MEELVVYTYKDEDSLKYDLSRSINKIKFINCDKLDFRDFKSYHLASLINDPNTICFYNIKYKQELLISLIVLIEQRIVWCFKSLPKNKKLYKELVKLGSSVHTSNNITKPKEKDLFIQDLCVKNNIPLKYVEQISQSTSECKFNIENEILKLTAAIEVCPELALTLLSNYNSDSDLFNLCIYLLTDEHKSVFYSTKVMNNKTSVNFIYSMIIKRLMYYLQLALNNEEEAKRFWRGSSYYLSKDKVVAKEVYGTDRLLELIKLMTTSVDLIFGDSEYSYVFLTNFIVNIYYESNYSRI